MKNPFTEHCHAVGETYGEHLEFAVRSGAKLSLGGLACVVHGLFPFLFQTTGSRTVAALHARFTSRARKPAFVSDYKEQVRYSVERELWRYEHGGGI